MEFDWNSIKCLLTTKEKLELVKYLLKEVSLLRSDDPFYVCNSIDEYFWRRNSNLIQEMYEIFEKAPNLLYPMDSGQDDESTLLHDESYTEALLRSFLPEFLKYRPKILHCSEGFWNPRNHKSRIKALTEVKEELENTLSKEESAQG